MKKIQLLLFSITLIAFIGCKDETKKVEEEVVQEVKKEEGEEVEKAEKVVKKVTGANAYVSFALEPKSGTKARGKAGMTEKDGEVTLEVKISGLEPGTHAIHIHEKADCSSADGKSSGGHWNPTFQDHGKWGDPKGYHKGDIGNFVVSEDGVGHVNFTTDEWCIGCGDEKRDVLGKAIIVHQGTDDFTSQPSGAAGARVSCGGIIQ
ncbi:MAG: superoxide dismutase family protein [Bacteroidota bacterium]